VSRLIGEMNVAALSASGQQAMQAAWMIANDATPAEAAQASGIDRRHLPKRLDDLAAELDDQDDDD
jgi:hypothetical protein